jgi:uncharacterized repeat protein (TIGR01451 family)
MVFSLRVRGFALALVLLGATAMPLLAVQPSATVTATKEAATAAGPNGSTQPGGTIDYKITITNTGGTTATSVSVTDAAPAHTSDVGSYKVSPLAFPDAYNAIKNTLLHVNAPGVLTNDKGVPTPSAVPIANGPTTGGGTVTLNPDGSFDYNPANNFTGEDTFTYTVTNTQLPNDTATVTITTCPTITVTNPANANGAVDAAFSETFTQTGGTGTITFTLNSGALPPGLTLASNGTLSGTPTQPGSFPITVTATDANGCPGTGATYTVVIGCQIITVTRPTSSTGTVDTALTPAGSYTFSQTGVGTHTPAVFTINTGTLPSGVTLSTAGAFRRARPARFLPGHGKGNGCQWLHRHQSHLYAGHCLPDDHGYKADYDLRDL